MQVLALYTGLRARKKVCRTLLVKERNAIGRLCLYFAQNFESVCRWGFYGFKIAIESP